MLTLRPLLFVFFVGLIPAPLFGQVVLNEIQASNNFTIADEDGDYEDWIELYNTSDTDTAHLDHYGLSDDYDDVFRWVIPEGTNIEPGGFLLIWASGKDRRDPEQPLHTNFRIARDGEEILLTDPVKPPEDQRIDEIPPTPVPSDISYGRVTDGADEWVFFDKPTPGSSNTASHGFGTILSPPEASRSGGFYTGTFDLDLHHQNDDNTGNPVEIRYTLDGSEPQPDSPLYNDDQSIPVADRSVEPNDLSEIMEISHRYAPAASPLEKVFKGTVVRARAFREGDLPSPVMTETFFIHEDGSDRYSVPVITLNTGRENLFDFEDGIYVLGEVHQDWLDDGGGAFNGGAPANYNRRGREWERPANFTLFRRDGSKAVDQDIGIRIHGGWSRAFPQKSFRLYSRSDYGESRFRYRIFPNLELDDFNRLILRQSGQDVTSTMFRDIYIQEIVRHMRFDTQHFVPTVVFLNGEYWGIYNIRQRYDRHYIETHYGVGEDELDLLTRSAHRAKEGDNEDFFELRDGYFEENDISKPEHYEYVRNRIDIDNFIDYFIAQIFAANTDWPHNNIDFWRKNHGVYRPDAYLPEHDGRWRWMMFDTDFGFGWHSSVSDDMMNHVTGHGRYSWTNTLFDGLWANREFRDAFLNRFADMLNTTFHPGRTTELLDSLKAIYAPEITEHINRRGEAGNWNYPMGYREWQDEVNAMRAFAEERPEHQWRHLMGIDQRDTLRLTLDVDDPERGTVTVNSITISPTTTGVDKDPWPWSGLYFTDLPVTLTADPEDGFEFDRWVEPADENAYTYSTEPTIQVSPAGPLALKAIFSSKDTGVTNDENTPETVMLHQNYPNPFNPQTTIRFALPETQKVRIDIYDVTGQHVVRLLNDTRSAGHHQVIFDSSQYPELASGVYLYRLKSGDVRKTRKMLLIK